MVITPQVSQVLSSCLLESFSALVPAAAQPAEGAGNTPPLVLTEVSQRGDINCLAFLNLNPPS